MNEERQTTEVRETNVQEGPTTVQRQTVAQSTRVDSRIVASRVVWYIVGLIITLLVLRMVLLVLGANEANAFVGFVYALSSVFAWPFYGIFNYQPAYGRSVFEVSSLVAIIVYALIGWGISRLLTLNTATRTV